VDANGAVAPFTSAGRITLAVMAWMACWWLSEALHVAVTALLPLAVFPAFGTARIDQVAAPYAHPLIFLFLGGFLIALSMQRWGLDQRIALLTLTVVGPTPSRMVGGFMIVTAVLSMFVSNTATTAMMLPIGLSVVAIARPADGTAADDDPNLARCLMLGIAYAASIGGVATIIGTPPNAFLVAFLRDSIAEPYRLDIGFAQWLVVGLPLMAVMLPATWWLLTGWLYRPRTVRIEGGEQLIRRRLVALGRPTPGEWATLVVFLLTATAWITRPLLTRWTWGDARPLAGLSDAGIAMTGALALFAIPCDLHGPRFVMDWRTARGVPWGILILFGGGLSLASQVNAHGVADFIGAQVAALPPLSPVLLTGLVVMLVIFLTELTSNTATTATLLPIFAALAPGLGMHPHLLVIPAAIAASFAFMMPVATPPNAIVFASGHVTIPEMCRAGVWLNLFGVVVITAVTLSVVQMWFGSS